MVISELTRSTASRTDPLVRVSDTCSKENITPPNSDDFTDEKPTDDIHAPALRHNSRSAKSQLPTRYKHFTLQQSTILSGTFDICICLCICLHIILCVCHLHWKYSVRTLFKAPEISPMQTLSDSNGYIFNGNSVIDFQKGGEPKNVWSECSCLT